MDAVGTTPGMGEVERSRKLEPRATHGAFAEISGWLEGKHCTEMGEKPGKVRALVVKLGADCAAIRAKSGEDGYSEAMDPWGNGVYASYTPFLTGSCAS